MSESRDIFISYAREDAQAARLVAETLAREVGSVFWDRDIPAGTSYARFIGDQLAAARCVLVLWSRSSLDSDWVRDEAQEAKDDGRLVPVLLDGVRPPIGFGQLQSADLSGWEGDTEDERWKRLVRDIERKLEKPAGTAPLDRRSEAPRTQAGESVLIRGGTFWMGAQSKDPKGPGFDKDAIDNESPVRRVTVSDFRIGRFPVTVDEFRRFLEAGANGYLERSVWSPKGWSWKETNAITTPHDWKAQLSFPNRPVVGVAWYEADAYARWSRGALPTEAQWEYAARGREGRKYPWGDEAPSQRHSNFGASELSNVVDHPAGATPEGVRDLAGNVWEWCRDWYGDYRDAEEVDPVGPPEGRIRVLRGGSFYSYPRDLRGAHRGYISPESRFGRRGFRVVFASAGGRDQ